MSTADREPPEQAHLSLLGYDPAWARHGVLGLELLAAQAHAFGQPGADTHTEHYRAAALRSFLLGRETITDAELRGLLQIGEVEKRTALGSHVFYELVHRDVLSEAQLEIVAEACQEASLQRLVMRHRLLRRLRTTPDVRTIEACLAEGDGVVHRALLARQDIAPEHLERLSEAGANASVRRSAAARLRALRQKRPR